MQAGGNSGPLIREADGEDAAAVAQLLDQLGYPADAESIVERIARLRVAGDRVFVAELDGCVVGLAALQVTASLEYERPAAKLAALVVYEAHRGRGIGGLLVGAVEAEARRRGCVLLYLTTAERRGDAHTFYERLGLECTGRRYAKRLD